MITQLYSQLTVSKQQQQQPVRICPYYLGINAATSIVATLEWCHDRFQK